MDIIQNVILFKLASVLFFFFFLHKIPKWEHTDDFKESVIQADLMPLQLPFGFTANKRLNSEH